MRSVRLVTLAVALATGCGCAARPSGVSYAVAAERVEAMLRPRVVGREVFPYSVERTAGSTKFRFIEGNPRCKVDHMRERRVVVTIHSLDGGADASASVSSTECKFPFVTMRCHEAEERWRHAVADATGIPAR